MAKQHLILGLVLGGCAAAVGCSSDEPGNTVNVAMHSGGSGGSHAGGTGGGTSAGATNDEAGTGNALTGGTGGSGGSADTAGAGEGGAPDSGDSGSGGEAGAPVVVVPPLPLDPWTVVVTSAAPATFNHLLVTGTDYATTGEVASIELSPTAKVQDSTAYPDAHGDVVTVGSGGLGFVLQRSEDKLSLVNGSKVKTTFDLTDPGDAAAVALANKAYVTVYNYNFIPILDLDAGTVSSRIDLSEFNDATDSDGSVNTVAGMYDPVKKIAYFVLSRIDLGTFDASFHLPCSATKALLIGVDATTDAIVDLNGAADGKALELYLANPASAQLSSDGKTITVFDYGCYAGDLSKQGVELVHLDTASRTIAYAPTDNNAPADLILLGGQQALLHSYLTADPFEVWNRLDLGTGVLGAKLNNVPLGPVFDGSNVYGVTVDYSSQVASVVKYDAATDGISTVIASPWVGQYSAVATTALVK